MKQLGNRNFGRMATLCAAALMTMAISAGSARADEAGGGGYFVAGAQPERPSEVLATELRPLDDPENPYAGQYEEWDIWAYEHFRPGMNAQAIMADMAGPVPNPSKVMVGGPLHLALDNAGELQLWTNHHVDSEGFLIPSGRGEDITGRKAREFPQAFASGPIEQAQNDEWQLQITARSACKYGPIPAFIGEQPPVRLVFVPNGEFAVKGMLGLGDTDNFDIQTSGDLAARERWYRYSPEGELLGMTGVVGMGWRDDSWILLYWPELPQKIAEMKKLDLVPQFKSGTVSFAPSTARTYSNEADFLWDTDKLHSQTTAADVVECYDYLGQPIPVEQAWPTDGRMEDRARQLDAPIVKMYYEAQLAVGYTTDTPSPYAGQASGPQIATADYSPPVVAYPSMGGDYTFTEKLIVKALDTPGNPYAGQYSEWDRLCLEHYGERDREHLRLLNEGRNANLQLVDNARVAGQSLEEFKQANPDYATGFPAELPENSGFVSLFCYVDDDGYVVPMSQLHSWTGARTDGTQRTDWNISATISMDEEQRARFTEWKAGL